MESIGRPSSIADIAQSMKSGTNAGANSASGSPRDSKDSPTDPKFGDVYNQIQAKYGAKAEKPREIKKTLGKDDFLKIMVSQMKNQDPTNPFKAEQMATEIAQFTTVEQLQNVNSNINKLSAQNKPVEQMAMTNLIGKTVTIDRDRFPHTEGQNEYLSFSIPKNASSTKVTILNELGEPVFDKDLGNQPAGEVSFVWDGLKGNTLPTKSGNYTMKIDVQDEHGQAMDINHQAKAKIIGVSFEGVEPVFLVGDNKRQEKITMKNIVRIETDFGSNGQAAPQSAPSAGIAPIQQVQSAPNLFSFQKGVGSGNLDPTALPGDAAKAFEKLQAQQQAVAAPVAMPASQPAPMSAPQSAPLQEEKGFPNGLHD